MEIRTHFFFHRVAQIRKSKNAIRKLINARGEELTDSKLIKAEAVHYFQEFLNNSSSHLEYRATKL